MCQGLVGLVVEEPGIATAAVHPRTERLGPLVSVAGHVRPAHEDVREPALREVLGSGSYDPPAELVARDAAVAIRERRVGRDHVRRIGDEQAESFAGHGLEQVALPSSTTSIPLRAALNAANASARSFTSVPTTCAECFAASSAWIPQPVPRSRAASTERRTASFASVTEGADPRHPVARRLPTEQIGGDVVVAMRKKPNGRADALGGLSRDEPERVQPVERQRPDRILDL